MLDTPVLFIFFNRPEIAITSFNRIKEVRPRRLYLASDGARKDVAHEDVLVNETRKQILSEIDWDCEVKTLFRESNLGCGIGVYSAINWLFENEDTGIILEDDCIAEKSFFFYAEELLNRFAEDTRIGMIAGTNHINNMQFNTSYIFSKYKSCWGWATWKRAWANMDINMKWKNTHMDDVLYNLGYIGKDIKGWKYKVRCIENQRVSAWDWQWYCSLAIQNQLCIYPTHNLISNIGNDSKATHTAFSNITISSMPIEFPLIHPDYVVPDIEFEEKFYKSSNTIFIKIARLIPFGLKKKIKAIISKYY